VERLPKRKTFIELMVEDFSGAEASLRVELPTGVPVTAIERLVRLEWVMRDGVAALLPGDLEVH
jgi:hypothetical protein